MCRRSSLRSVLIALQRRKMYDLEGKKHILMHSNAHRLPSHSAPVDEQKRPLKSWGWGTGSQRERQWAAQQQPLRSSRKSSVRQRSGIPEVGRGTRLSLQIHPAYQHSMAVIPIMGIPPRFEILLFDIRIYTLSMTLSHGPWTLDRIVVESGFFFAMLKAVFSQLSRVCFSSDQWSL